MDSYYLHIVRTLGKAATQDEYDTQIVKEVWTDDYSNLNEGEATQACVNVYKARGVEAEQRCYNAYVGCGNNNKCNAIAAKYAEALERGYSKDFESFKKKSSVLAQTGEVIGGFLSGLLGDRRDNQNWNQGMQGGNWNQPPPRRNTGLIVGVGLLAVVGIGAAIYFANKKK